MAVVTTEKSNLLIQMEFYIQFILVVDLYLIQNFSLTSEGIV